MAIAFLILLTPDSSEAQNAFTNSDLPILLVDTRGLEIPDEPKISAHLFVIDNGPGQRNYTNDPPNAYDGEIGIELRGSTSQTLFDKKSYAMETRLQDGSNNNVALLGLPVENDWVLHAPYSDKSLIRNALTYELYRMMGRYASRLRFCELVINDEYQGVYVLLERVKRDNDRIDITRLEPEDTSGDALTGGYVIKVDKSDGAELGGWYSDHPTMTDPDRTTFYQYHYPRPRDMVSEQETYIQSFVDAFESMMASGEFADPVGGYPSMLDVPVAVDYVLISELTGNVDAYRLSLFLYKDRDSVDGRLVTGPPWDYNIAWGNANYYDGDRVDGFRIRYPLTLQDAFHGPFWWRRLLEDSVFTQQLVTRWRELRATVLSTTSISTVIDSLAALVDESHVRNFSRWPVLDQWIWPNVVVTGSHDSELNYLRSWTTGRLIWLDQHIDTIGGQSSGGGDAPGPGEPLLSPVFPNPAQSQIEFAVVLPTSQRVRLSLYDLGGRRVVDVKSGFLANDRRHTYRVSIGGLASGLYLLRLEGERDSMTRRVAVLSNE